MYGRAMIYRTAAKVKTMGEKEKLYLVTLSYTDEDNTSTTSQRWIRAKDSFKALKEAMKMCDTKANKVWFQNVHSVDDFFVQETEIE